MDLYRMLFADLLATRYIEQGEEPSLESLLNCNLQTLSTWPWVVLGRNTADLLLCYYHFSVEVCGQFMPLDRT